MSKLIGQPVVESNNGRVDKASATEMIDPDMIADWV